ncbi:MAG: hypothetical protein D3910_04780 [Candidatus Electrothrix sp. ATG2]|nr:hypothetical protein [Candidatus Electrothrix sp. ATG2]
MFTPPKKVRQCLVDLDVANQQFHQSVFWGVCPVSLLLQQFFCNSSHCSLTLWNLIFSELIDQLKLLLIDGVRSTLLKKYGVSLINFQIRSSS